MLLNLKMKFIDGFAVKRNNKDNDNKSILLVQDHTYVWTFCL